MTGGHPDATLIAAMRAAADWWEAQPPVAPTCPILGSGAVEALEAMLARRFTARFALALPSGTSALRAAFLAVHLGPDDVVSVPTDLWPAAAGAAGLLGAEVAVDDPTADIVVLEHDCSTPFVRTERPIIEDRAAAPAECRCRVRGIAACLSFGPRKALDCGGGGALITSSTRLFDCAVQATQHPTRQLLRGVIDPDAGNLAERMPPALALLVLHRIAAQRDNLLPMLPSPLGSLAGEG